MECAINDDRACHPICFSVCSSRNVLGLASAANPYTTPDGAVRIIQGSVCV